MEFLLRKDIDTEKWNARIAADPIENIFCYAWYLDAVSKNWGAFMEGDYQTIVPIPFSSKLSVKSLYQPPFTREIDIFGGDFSWETLIPQLTKIFRSVHFRNRQKRIFPDHDERVYQFIDLTATLSYSTNANRLIKKAEDRFNYVTSNKPKKLIELFRETAFKKIDSITDRDLIRLENLMTAALENKKGDLFEIHQSNTMVGAGFFLQDKNRITYLKGASTEEAKKDGAMFGLINFAIENYRDGYPIFDFGGSDIENVANFYKKFGAKDHVYYNYDMDNLPLWFKTLKRVKK